MSAMAKRHRKRPVKLGGYVWCDRRGDVHADRLDPYEHGPPGPGETDERCKPEDHRPVYIWAAPSEGEF